MELFTQHYLERQLHEFELERRGHQGEFGSDFYRRRRQYIKSRIRSSFVARVLCDGISPLGDFIDTECEIRHFFSWPQRAGIDLDSDNFNSSFSSQVADLQETKTALLSVAKKVFEIKAGAESLHDTAEVKQCRAVIRFISKELRYIEAEFYKLYFQAVLWLLLFIAEKCDSSRSLPVRVLSVSQALEEILIACGDVEENPGPTFFDVKEVAEICNHRLVEDDCSVVLKAVSSIAGRYSPLLRLLGLPESQLSEIKVECRDNPQECLQKGIICLLQENFNTDKYGPLTWRRLVLAVADTAGGSNHTLARKIAAEHKELPDSLVDRERESLKPAAAATSPSTQRKYKQSGSFAVMFPKLKRSLERSVKPDDLKEFLHYFCNPATPEHCLIDEKLYNDLDSTSEILDSLHPTYINPANLLLLQEIVDNFGSKQSKRLYHDYKSQWE